MSTLREKTREVLNGKRHSVYCPSCTWDMSIGMLCCGNVDTCPIKKAIKAGGSNENRTSSRNIRRI